jgi:hypothetical protein
MEVAMRAFGDLEDLDLELTSADRPSLVTALLARCVQGGADHWWAQPVGVRIAALLRLYMHSEGSDNVELSARCMHAGCAESFGFALPLGQLAAWEPDGETWEAALSDERSVTLRRPTGRDLAQWRSARPAKREEALRMMVNDLVVRGHAAPQDEALLADVVSARDPLVALTLSAPCPACGHAQDVAVDLEGLVLARLASRQRALLNEVHRLAAHYGWSEQEVIAVPPRRRAAYLALIDGGVQ